MEISEYSAQTLELFGSKTLYLSSVSKTIVFIVSQPNTPPNPTSGRTLSLPSMPPIRNKDPPPKRGIYKPRPWSLPPGAAVCFNPSSMHKIPNKTQTWRVWGIYIPLSGQFSTDHEVLLGALSVLARHEEPNSTDRIRTGPEPHVAYAGGLHYRFWARDEDIQKGLHWLIKVARYMMELDYHIDYLNYLSWEIYSYKENQRLREVRAGRGDTRRLPYPKMHPARQVKYPWL